MAFTQLSDSPSLGSSHPASAQVLSWWLCSHCCICCSACLADDVRAACSATAARVRRSCTLEMAGEAIERLLSAVRRCCSAGCASSNLLLPCTLCRGCIQPLQHALRSLPLGQFCRALLCIYEAPGRLQLQQQMLGCPNTPLTCLAGGCTSFMQCHEVVLTCTVDCSLATDASRPGRVMSRSCCSAAVRGLGSFQCSSARMRSLCTAEKPSLICTTLVLMKEPCTVEDVLEREYSAELQKADMSRQLPCTAATPETGTRKAVKCTDHCC